ncbi:3-oxoacyl-[acyl-carrier-protein] synthase II [Bradyrhizobium elkanii]|jgi:3-oxoacyl-[acyl-carrier-protein] synthase II|uniref:3-oxoacyl-[acyl-carrier-protein] synthase 2 n=1 Tax=Bradyrhizobium elkanii TaxID=29448 RepID=A0A8I2CA42_BRAEL|nr:MULTISPECIES: beta-ketoacyl-ACP synthase II [Bradyrhizobium]MBP1298071.1 3-oxoacyl-[acyl-carrier-protein] synthase II [Bradyrhizobium elkanii]MCP1931218.1 3-oxoacyl-[acyl-carrier-protein] synthase II [Bradyrhizobium elkanii]MCS3480657.1 3-oxoacyl-[acyl-carrier-protein] synthase II [Bradyrhizobium elkanii]MCS3517465.1 3-oxoacyl-[acyl-carrier-protein] synthase II [Bradyrhizobium elkanii]MCS3578256.1 3-oxoacyl-[acyl-carrier-protein] synthase II [Bradyrhizobium elkanii]
MRRVVVTGLGMLTPLGCGVDATWARILAGDSGGKKIDTFDVSDLPSQVACYIPRGDGTGGTFNPDQWMEPKDQRKVDDFILYAMCAAKQALDDANWHPKSDEDQFATGTMIGSGIGGLTGIAETAVLLKERGPRRVSPFFIPGRLINLASGYVSIEHGLKGPNHAVVTACSTGAHAVGDAARLIALGDAEVMVAGGAESPISRIGIAGFCAARALSTGFNETPQKASRPYDKDRDGFVMGEGAGVLVLEEYEHAKRRGAKIYAEVTGYGLSGDAFHITSPPPDGNGGFRSMSMALKRAGLAASDLDYINAHGTSTQVGDEIELGAVERLLGNAASKVSMSSTKSATGHLLGAAGAIEAIFAILAIRDNVVPPTINLDNPSVQTAIDLVPHTSRKRDVNVALSNSFGFGGTNASVIVQRVTN